MPPRKRTQEQYDKYKAYHKDYYNRYTKLGLLKGKKCSVSSSRQLRCSDETRQQIHAYWAQNPMCSKYILRDIFHVSLSEAKYLLDHMPIYVHPVISPVSVPASSC
jgi:hypothetical protein